MNESSNVFKNKENNENKMPDLLLNESAIDIKDTNNNSRPLKQPINASKFDKMNIPDTVLLDKEKAFELFKSNYQSTQAFEDNKNLLKEKIKDAKNFGQDVAQHRTKINDFKNEIEKIRRDMAAQGLINMDEEVNESPKETELRLKIENEKKQ